MNETEAPLYPPDLADQAVNLKLAGKLANISYQGIRYAILVGRLPAIGFRVDTVEVSWQVKIRDLAEYTKRPLDPKWLAYVEECRNWTAGKEVPRGA